jgi:crossover junction endodeoxyribonuclease RuvC
MRIGIDPGISGAVAFLSDKLVLEIVFDMPVMPMGKNKQQINPYELAKLLRPCEDAAVYLEQVSAMPKQGVSSTFGFGVSFGIIQGVLAGLGLPVVMVPPVVWKRRAKLVGKDKDQARTLAQRLYPSAELGRKKDIGRADAILIARFGE